MIVKGIHKIVNNRVEEPDRLELPKTAQIEISLEADKICAATDNFAIKFDEKINYLTKNLMLVNEKILEAIEKNREEFKNVQINVPPCHVEVLPNSGETPQVHVDFKAPLYEKNETPVFLLVYAILFAPILSELVKYLILTFIH